MNSLFDRQIRWLLPGGGRRRAAASLPHHLFVACLYGHSIRSLYAGEGEGCAVRTALAGAVGRGVCGGGGGGGSPLPFVHALPRLSCAREGSVHFVGPRCASGRHLKSQGPPSVGNKKSHSRPLSQLLDLCEALRADPASLWLVLLISCAQFVGLALQTMAYQMTDPGQASLMLYLMIPQAYVLQFLVFHEPLTRWGGLGMGLIVVACAANAAATLQRRQGPHEPPAAELRDRAAPAPAAQGEEKAP